MKQSGLRQCLSASWLEGGEGVSGGEGRQGGQGHRVRTRIQKDRDGQTCPRHSFAPPWLATVSASKASPCPGMRAAHLAGTSSSLGTAAVLIFFVAQGSHGGRRPCVSALGTQLGSGSPQPRSLHTEPWTGVGGGSLMCATSRGVTPDITSNGI